MLLEWQIVIEASDLSVIEIFFIVFIVLFASTEYSIDKIENFLQLPIFSLCVKFMLIVWSFLVQ